MMETHWQEIQEELKAVMATRPRIPTLGDVEPGQYKLAGTQGWRTFFLYGFGHQEPENCRRCPRTTALLAEVPGLQTAFFSILSPGKCIPRHQGYYKGFVRGHLGLMVPGEPMDCTLHFDDTEVSWEEGRCFVFDDTYPHWVTNTLEEERVVLLFDFRRPLAFPMNWVNRGLLALVKHSPIVREARQRLRDWDSAAPANPA